MESWAERNQEEGAGKEEEEAPCQEEVCLSQDHGDAQEVTSPEVTSQDVQRERTRRKSLKQERRATGGVSGQPRLLRLCPRSLLMSSSTGKRHGAEPRGPGPFFFFGGSNGAEIVSGCCESRGWTRIYNKHREDFKLKWCETKSLANYCNFREGEQLLFQIPNNQVLTSKIGLLSSLREYERVSSKVDHGQGHRRLKMEDFIPTTFRMDVKAEREAFFARQEAERSSSSNMWICKPSGLNQGRGIFLLRNQDDVDSLRLKLVETQENRKLHHCQAQARVVQLYIQRPLLLQGKKFDVRSFLFIACTAPYMVFFRHGYVRLTCDLYDPGSNNLSTHLTNQYMQKKNPLYSQLKEDTVWSMESFNTYVNTHFQKAQALPRDWVLGPFTRQMQRIMTQCFLAVKSKLDRRLGLFDLIGCDFMVDQDFQVWLLEMNCNPALHTNCEVLREVIPTIIQDTLDVTLEIFNKRRLGQRLRPLLNQRDLVPLYNAASPPDPASPCNTHTTHTLRTRTRTQRTEPSRCREEAEPKHDGVRSSKDREEQDRAARPPRRKNLRPRVRFGMSTSTLHRQPAGDVMTQQKIQGLISPSSSQQREEEPAGEQMNGGDSLGGQQEV